METFNIIQPSDWYKVTRKDILDRNGGRLFNHYETLFDALKHVYPNYSWEYRKDTPLLRQVKDGYWDNVNHQRILLQRIGQELGIKEV